MRPTARGLPNWGRLPLPVHYRNLYCDRAPLMDENAVLRLQQCVRRSRTVRQLGSARGCDTQVPTLISPYAAFQLPPDASLSPNCRAEPN